MTQRLGAGVLDALIIFFACCIFIGTSQIFRASAPIDQFVAAIQTCSIALITVFYVFLFKLGGRATPGQTWQKRRLNQALEHPRQIVTQLDIGSSEFSLLTAWTTKSPVSKRGATILSIN